MINNSKSGMSLIVRTVTGLVVCFIMLFGIYIILHGHLSPGGGFAGGVMVALSFVLLVLAFGKNAGPARLSKNLASNLESIGALMFLGIALLGFAQGAFFRNVLGKGSHFDLFSAGTIPLSNIAIGLKVAVGLFAIFLALVILEKFKEGQ